MGLGTEDGFVEECHRVTGDWCLLLKARAASPLALQELIDRVRAVPGVQATMTTLALSSLHGTEEPT
jgi:Lrp/AsnC family leucine-responsive transcriptional regulator